MLLALVLALVLQATPVPEPSPEPSPSASASASPRTPTAAGEAAIVNSGSTNFAGYRLRVWANGTTALEQEPASATTPSVKKRVPAALVKRFFADLKAAGPLDQLPSGRCMKSASFGSTLHVEYGGKSSPDLSCPSGSRAAAALATDVSALVGAAGVSPAPRGHGA